MEIGKVPESVLKRSIFKQIHTKRPEVLVGAGVGEDCAAMELAPGEVFVFSTDPITGTEKNMGSLAVQITANDLASAGAEPVAMLLTVLLPPSADEPLIRTLMQEVDEACGKLNIQIMGGDHSGRESAGHLCDRRWKSSERQTGDYWGSPCGR